ncbi:hsp70-binding protein 1 isoform X3 [Dendrobates tinctorius]|uniref:hsp70-binding protein 1 isoform X3 n=1 Tax=Dendrobates tinctorius TaxID=92724 RepID=UPI003CCA50D9
MVPDSAGSIQPVAIISPVCPQLEAQTLCAPTPCDVSPATRWLNTAETFRTRGTGLWNIMAEEEGRQHPRSLQGLLHMAIEAGTEPGSELQTGQMSHERRQWLQEAMSSAFSGQADEVQQMKECLRELSGGTSDEDGAERKEKALELLADLCENLDNASDFCKLGGMSLMLTRYLSSPEAELRWRTADLIGTCSQNVPFVQEMALSLGAVSKLLKLLDLDTSETVRIKALFAISCTLCAMGMIQQLVSLLRTEHSPFHEHVLSAMCSMATDFPQGVAECQAPELAFEDLLKERCKMVEKQEEYQEELDYCQRLLKICFRDNPEDNGMDR